MGFLYEHVTQGEPSPYDFDLPSYGKLLGPLDNLTASQKNITYGELGFRSLDVNSEAQPVDPLNRCKY